MSEKLMALIHEAEKFDTMPIRSSFEESLSPEEAKTRHEAIRIIQKEIKKWIGEKIPQNQEFDKKCLTNLLQHLIECCRPQFDAITVLFDRHEKYAERPSIELFSGEQGKSPDIWIFGWRDDYQDSKVDETDIHDHVGSEAAIHVYKGAVKEVIYAFDEAKWRADSSIVECQTAERDLLERSTITIGAPYIHRIQDVDDEKLAVSIHGYYPPLSEMNLYEETGDGKLLRIAKWKESPEAKRAC